MPETITVTGDNLTLDLLLWRRYGVRGQDLIEEAMRLNPERVEPFLPVGAEVILPDLPAATTPERAVVTLFG